MSTRAPHFLRQHCARPSAAGTSPTARAQHGSVLVQFALLAAVLIAILGAVQIGYMYYAKRDLQRMADLAALEATNALSYGVADTCATAQTAATQSLDANQRLALTDETRTIDCGYWNASKADALRFSTVYGNAPTNPLNATRVTLQGTTLQLLPFTGSRVVAATATAAKNDEPIAAFTVGSQLLRFNNNGLLGRITAAVGLDITRLTILDKDGIANAKITPAGLLQFLGLPVGVHDLALLTPNDLANVDASLLDLIDAAINAGGDNLLNAGVDLAALVDLRAYLSAMQIANVKVPLGGDHGLLAMISAGGNASPIGAGLDVAIDLADLVRTQLAIANGKNSVALALGIPGLVSAGLTVVEPPTYAVGPADGTTKARSAQVRLGIEIGRSANSASQGLLGVLGVNLHIPIQVDLVRSTGTLEALQCTAVENARTANISVRSAIGDVCIGELNANGQCQKTTLVDVDLLGILGGLTIDSKVSTSLLEGASLSSPPNAQACPFNNSTLDECLVGMHVDDPKMSGPNGLHLGQTVTSLLNQVPSLIGDTSNAKVNGVLGVLLWPILALLGGLNFLLQIVVGIVTTLLSPILNVIGGVLDALLVSLGIELGRAQIDLLSIQCDTAQLVY